ncbi:MAG TPA: AMP-binding protein, partial [Solirubrobacteraceae bacterium]|nr:AMP-binding protein [Solirubrobacteraceae bacterium]
MNLAENLSLSAAKTPEAAAVRLDDEVRSYRALDDASARVAGLLASRGVGPGDRVGIMLPNVPLFPIIYYGILRLGATVVPMNVLLKGRETAHYLKDPGAKAVFAWQAFAEHAQTGAAEAGAECIEAEPEGFARLLQDAEPHTAVTPRDGSETAVILYTSGTTGVPKGAELSHDNLAHNCRAAAGLFGIGAATVTLGALPLFHSFGTAASLGFKPQWILQGPAFVEQLITKDGSLKATPTPVAAALKGALVTSFSAPWDDPDAPGMRQ